jgi:hypothetical protein
MADDYVKLRNAHIESEKAVAYHASLLSLAKGD